MSACSWVDSLRNVLTDIVEIDVDYQTIAGSRRSSLLQLTLPASAKVANIALHRVAESLPNGLPIANHQLARLSLVGLICSRFRHRPRHVQSGMLRLCCWLRISSSGNKSREIHPAQSSARYAATIRSMWSSVRKLCARSRVTSFTALIIRILFFRLRGLFIRQTTTQASIGEL